jgi:hypothetical protein
MPVAKLGQSSINEVNNIQQKHWDIDMKIRDVLAAAPLNVKQVLASRLPSIVNEIDSELKANMPQI